MKKALPFLLSVFLLLTVCGCSSTKAPEAVIAQRPVVLGNYGIPRPDWVIIDVSTQDVHFAAGYGKMSTLQNSIKRAQAEAKNLIAEWVSTAVDEIIVTYTNDAGTDTDRQALDAFEAVGKQRAQAILSGTKQEDLWEDADGGVWVLMSIPVENVASQMYGAASEAASSANKGFMKNEAAKEANDMLNDAIDKYFSSQSVTDQSNE